MKAPELSRTFGPESLRRSLRRAAVPETSRQAEGAAGIAAPQHVLDQKAYRIPSSVLLGRFACVVGTTPKSGEVGVVLGKPKVGVFVAL
jgi:hypothetical protein